MNYKSGAGGGGGGGGGPKKEGDWSGSGGGSNWGDPRDMRGAAGGGAMDPREMGRGGGGDMRSSMADPRIMDQHRFVVMTLSRFRHERWDFLLFYILKNHLNVNVDIHKLVLNFVQF